MKTPEDIKKGLECCNTFNDCQQCPYDNDDEGWSCTVERNADALAYIEQLEAREWELFDLLSSVWHGKQYYFKQDDGTVYSRQSCEYLTFDQAIDEFANELIGQYSDTQKLKWRSPKSEPPDVDMFFAVTKFDPEIRIYKRNLIDQHYTAEWLNIRNDILWWMPIPEVPAEPDSIVDEMCMAIARDELRRGESMHAMFERLRNGEGGKVKFAPFEKLPEAKEEE